VAGKGFFLYKKLMTEVEADRYRLECKAFFKSGPRIAKWPGYGVHRLNRDHVGDYVFSRSNAHSSKIYQFPANPQSSATEAIFNRTLSIRDAIEGHWLQEPEYRRIHASQRDYVQVSQYLEGQGINRHSDSVILTPYPLVQCVCLISQPGTDFSGGELVLHTRSGESIRAHEDLGMNKGDALFFDKALVHEVRATTQVGSNDIGRWSAVIGARFRKPNALRRITMRLSQFARKTLSRGAS
jgi:hypothetical protein